MSSCGAGGQSVISVHCLLESKRFGRDSRFMSNKIFGPLAANVGSGSTDGGLSNIAICSVHGCFGSSLRTVVLLIAGFVGGLFCGACLVLCFWASFTIRGGGRSPATAEAAPVCVGHGQNDRSGKRRGNRVGFFHREDVRFSGRPLLDSHSRWRRVSRALSSPAGTMSRMAQREE